MHNNLKLYIQLGLHDASLCATVQCEPHVKRSGHRSSGVIYAPRRSFPALVKLPAHFPLFCLLALLSQFHHAVWLFICSSRYETAPNPNQFRLFSIQRCPTVEHSPVKQSQQTNCANGIFILVDCKVNSNMYTFNPKWLCYFPRWSKQWSCENNMSKCIRSFVNRTCTVICDSEFSDTRLVWGFVVALIYCTILKLL